MVATNFGGPQPINENTVFPTASFSKWIAAITVMSLAKEGVLTLDAPVGRYLAGWQLPDSAFNHREVTIRRLLSHTAGLTDGLGYGDYLTDQTLPTLWESLDAPRASDGAAEIAVGIEPGSEFRYSGGGYLTLEALLEEFTGDSYAELAEERLLVPLGMTRSTHGDIAALEKPADCIRTRGMWRQHIATRPLRRPLLPVAVRTSPGWLLHCCFQASPARWTRPHWPRCARPRPSSMAPGSGGWAPCARPR